MMFKQPSQGGTPFGQSVPLCASRRQLTVLVGISCLLLPTPRLAWGVLPNSLGSAASNAWDQIGHPASKGGTSGSRMPSCFPGLLE